jgi:hypothetical protein
MRPALLLALMFSCSDAAPCTMCPPIEGTWNMQYAAPITQGCNNTVLAAAPNSVQIGRMGSQLTCAIDLLPMTGTLYDTYDFSIIGNESQLDGGSRSVQLRGHYIPGPHDGGGDTLSGSLDRSVLDCTQSLSFTGARF